MQLGKLELFDCSKLSPLKTSIQWNKNTIEFKIRQPVEVSIPAAGKNAREKQGLYSTQVAGETL